MTSPQDFSTDTIEIEISSVHINIGHATDCKIETVQSGHLFLRPLVVDLLSYIKDGFRNTDAVSSCSPPGLVILSLLQYIFAT